MITAVYLNDRQCFKSYLWWQDAQNGGPSAKFQTFDDFKNKVRAGFYHWYGIKVIYRP